MTSSKAFIILIIVSITISSFVLLTKERTNQIEGYEESSSGYYFPKGHLLKAETMIQQDYIGDAEIRITKTFPDGSQEIESRKLSLCDKFFKDKNHAIINTNGSGSCGYSIR